MKNIVTLNDLMLYYLQSLLDAELRWSEALQEFRTKASSEQLKQYLVKSAELCRNHLRILAEILEDLKEQQSFEKALIIKGMIDEMSNILKYTADPEVRDAAIIVFHQCITHFKIAQYGSVNSFANLLGFKKVSESLRHLLEEEKGGDEALSILAETKINPEAQSPLLK